ncbi:MAG: DNA/RNA non-specific endonuclease [Roseburia sp.]|nr:DNA/RNA non-specific endonuclease [Roseburia sp.]
MKRKGRTSILFLFLAGFILISELANDTAVDSSTEIPEATYFDGTYSFGEYEGSPYIEVNGNRPFFREEDMTKEAFETYSELDEYGRCGTAYANVCRELMPTEERGEIGKIKPSGWHTVKYPDVIKDLYLYNRCHLIAFCLAGENANEKNLITGTRYMNMKGMLPFETEVASYVEETGNHVLYRVTPVFEEDNLVADGVLMEACSVEDSGEGICFCVYVYNVQPGIEIDYATGDSRQIEE